MSRTWRGKAGKRPKHHQQRTHQIGRNCPTGKKAWRTREEAEAAIARLRDTTTGRQVPTRAYECPRCTRYHLTSLPVWVEEKWRRTS